MGEERRRRGEGIEEKGKRRGSFVPTVVFKTRCLGQAGRLVPGACGGKRRACSSAHLTAQLISRCGVPVLIDYS